MAVLEEQRSLPDEKGDRQDRPPSELWNRWLPRIAGYAFFLGVWHFASGTLVPDFLLPSPITIAESMVEILASGLFLQHFGSTLRKIAIGYAIAFALGSTIGILMARPWFDGFFRDWVLSIMSTPGLVFALIAAMIFGFSATGPIVAIVVTSFPFITVNIAEGVRALPRDLKDMSRAFRVSGYAQLRHVTIPFLAPYTFTAMRYGFSIAWKIATLTEVFGSSSGIGFMMRREFQSFAMANMLSWIIFFFIFALLLEILLQRTANRYFRWRQEPVGV